jgi:ABC-2 type transport system permease protein
MSDNEFVLVKEKGWSAGFLNMLDKENARWWGRRNWVVQLVLWFLLLNIPVLFILYVNPYLPSSQGITYTTEKNAQLAAQVFFAISALYLPFGISILTHDSIIKEREQGTMAWILSKPISRKSFILSKIVANIAGVIILMVAIQGVITYGIISAYIGNFINVVNFFGALGIIALLSLFFLSMISMLGTMTLSRYAVLGAAVTFIILGMAASQVLPDISTYLTWKLSETTRDFAMSGSLTSNEITQLVATGVWIVIFFLVSLIRIEQIEV